jgi:hypothetical protein
MDAIHGMPETGCAVDRAIAANEPGFYPCIHAFCENPNASVLTSGMVCRTYEGGLVRPDLWPPYCYLGKLAALPEVPYLELVGLHHDEGLQEF